MSIGNAGIGAVSVVNGKDKIGLAALVLMLLGGGWLAAAPWIVGHQARGHAWTVSTMNEFWVGVGLVALAVTALVVFAANALRSLATATRQRPGDPADVG